MRLGRTYCIAALAMLVVGMAACVSAPAADARKGIGTSVQRVLALDLSRPALAERSRRLRESGSELGSLAVRTPTAETAQQLSTVPPRRLAGLSRSTNRLLEFALRSRWQSSEWLAADAEPRRLAERITESLAGMPWVLGADRRPLGELDDLRHRTDPDDDRAEASLLDRLRRRLQL